MNRTRDILFLFFAAIISIAFCRSIAVDTGNSQFSLEYIDKPTGRYVTTDEISKISDRRFYSSIKRKESLSIAGESFVFSPDNRFVVVSEATYDLGDPTIVRGDGMLVPLDGFLRVMAARFGMGAHIDGDVALFNGDPIYQPVDTSPVEEPCPEPQIEATAETQTPEPDTDLPESTSPATEAELETLPDEPAAPSSEPETSQPKASEGEPERKTSWLVVIDPGHGGKDPGASASDGTREKQIVLEISKLLHEELNSDPLFDAVLTRDTDVFIPLRDRTKFANENNADLFVSIHCNAARNKSARGAQVFFLAPASSDHARATAALENASIFLEEPDTTDDFNELDFIMADVIQNEFLREASRLSVLVEEAIVEKTGLTARGPQGAGFYVLKGSYMPGILVETAFISNPDEALLLQQENFRESLVDGIAEGIRLFLSELPDN